MPDVDSPRRDPVSRNDGLAHPVCPECETRLSAQSGCLVCRECGWSRCAA
jgi:hypothetical protein